MVASAKGNSRSGREMTIGQVRRYARATQRRFRLTEWKLYVSFDPDLIEADKDGCISWVTDYKEAHLSVAPGHTNSRTKATVRHELLHLLLQGYGDLNKEREPMLEFALNTLAEIL